MTRSEDQGRGGLTTPVLLRRVRAPVRRQGARFYLLLTLLSFASSVTLTRLFLELTGYPQLASGDLHIAHVLWGGLLLFVASLLPLVFANRWVYTISSLSAGVGVGLFIDEVGKFITRSNDYFYPAAAPIVYAVFLITAVIYLQARRPHVRGPRTELYQALETFEEVLDRDLQPEELADLRDRLGFVMRDPVERDLARLAGELLSYLDFTRNAGPPVAGRPVGSPVAGTDDPGSAAGDAAALASRAARRLPSARVDGRQPSAAGGHYLPPARWRVARPSVAFSNGPAMPPTRPSRRSWSGSDSRLPWALVCCLLERCC